MKASTGCPLQSCCPHNELPNLCSAQFRMIPMSSLARGQPPHYPWRCVAVHFRPFYLRLWELPKAFPTTIIHVKWKLGYHKHPNHPSIPKTHLLNSIPLRFISVHVIPLHQSINPIQSQSKPCRTQIKLSTPLHSSSVDSILFSYIVTSFHVIFMHVTSSSIYRLIHPLASIRFKLENPFKPIQFKTSQTIHLMVFHLASPPPIDSSN